MNQDQFIEMCKRMVVEYYNRYVHMMDYSSINIDNVQVIEISESKEDSRGEILLQVDIDPWLQYKIICDLNKRGDIRVISSSVEMT